MFAFTHRFSISLCFQLGVLVEARETEREHVEYYLGKKKSKIWEFGNLAQTRVNREVRESVLRNYFYHVGLWVGQWDTFSNDD